jgi:hypothetical protein
VSAGLPWVWGATEEEAARPYAADDLVGGAPLRMTRAVDVDAPVGLCWRWLCQVALAPYSYDLVDNLGRRSPQHLVPGTDQLRVGQSMTVFRVESFEAGHQWTGLVAPRRLTALGRMGATYAAEPGRLVARLTVPGGSAVERARGLALAWGDLVMMRRQLLNLAALAERDHRAGPA